ncbi:MAG: lipid-A-disaccharide synthase [Bacteroidales bacterium]|nr:lipid-A-disaccharide synthase [Bacteroidales bacterium]
MKYYIIAGEASGDLHASNLMKALKLRDPEAEFRAWGGDLMHEQGATLVKHINELAFMGFIEVLLNLSTILKNIKLCKNDIVQYKPDAVIFIDYPGFNLRIAEFARKNKIRTIYYISPQVWAWNKSRVKKIRRDIDKMLVILPFEEQFYEKYNFPVEFVGHPLLDALEVQPDIDSFPEFITRNNLPDTPIIALLPGSRKQEISKMLPTMCKVSEHFTEYQFVIAGTKAHSDDFYHKYSNGKNLPVVYGQTYNLLRNAKAAMVTSGTATLETALIGTPQIVCYKASQVSYLIARNLVDIKYISLVNLIMDDEVVKEMIQSDFNTRSLVSEMKRITSDQKYSNTIMKKYALLRKKLGGSGASDKAAKAIIGFLNE